MTTQQKIAALYAMLAATTKACPCGGCNHLYGSEHHKALNGCACHGTGKIARFPGFRQECRSHRTELGGSPPVHSLNCLCNGLGWHVRAGGLEDALAGLPDAWSRTRVMSLLMSNINQMNNPSADAILLKGLELVIKIAELEVPK